MRQPLWRAFNHLPFPPGRTKVVDIGTQRRSLLTESYAQGPATPPLLDQTIPEHFASSVSKFGDRTAVVSRHQHTRLSYNNLDRKSNELARGLWSIGVKKGDRVAVILGNNVENAIATYAIFKLGAILVPLNPAFNANQVVAALNHLQASHLIIGAETNLPRKSPRSNIPLLQRIIPDLQNPSLESKAIPSLSQTVLVDNSNGRIDTNSLKPLINYTHLLNNNSSSSSSTFKSDHTLSPFETINIQFTSGTTSLPKAACLTHRSILNNGASIGDRMRISPTDIICCPPPLFHCFGSILGYMATATHGASIVFPSEAFDPLATLKAVQEEKCTGLYGVPTMFLAELELLSNGTVPHSGFEHLRTGIAAGSSIPAELMRKLHGRLNLRDLCICYGMTETSPVSAMTGVDDPLARRVDSVGKLLPHVEAKIVDPRDRGRVLPVGERGELAVSGYLVMKGYWDDEAKTNEVMIPDENGKIWMHTGDEALLSPNGYLHITGRIKDLIIRGGENVHPLEIENCLLSHPQISDASIVGLPDERYGEVVAAFVVRAAVVVPMEKGKGKSGGNTLLTEEDVREWVRKNAGHWLDDYPKTASGKIQKFKLRAEGVRLLKESEQAAGKEKGRNTQGSV
ncbi:MAG: hypothetical protein Q9186_004649 [Xanthomendoza sp. 1 TL-2023]